MSAYRLTVSCFAFSHHCRRSRHIVVYVLCSRCASICSLIRFVTSRWYSVLGVSVLVYTVCSSCRCRRVTSAACALQ